MLYVVKKRIFVCHDILLGMLRLNALTTPRAFRQHDPLEDIIKGDIVIHDDSDVEVSIDGPALSRRESDSSDGGSDSVHGRDSLGEYPAKR